MLLNDAIQRCFKMYKYFELLWHKIHHKFLFSKLFSIRPKKTNDLFNFWQNWEGLGWIFFFFNLDVEMQYKSYSFLF